MNSRGGRGLIAVDKMGGKVLFLDPDSYATTHILDDFERLPHELLVPPQSSTAYTSRSTGMASTGAIPTPAICCPSSTLRRAGM